MKNTPVKEQSTSTTSLPAWLNQASQSNYDFAKSLPDFVPYTGQGVAGLTPDQQQAFDLMRSTVGAGQSAAAPAGAGFSNAMNFTAPQLTADGISSTVTGLMNPYQSQVVDAANAEIERQRILKDQQNGAAAAKAGAFGGDRYGVVQGMNDRDFMTTKANTTASLLKGGYDTALSTALSMGQGNQNAALQGAGINLQGAAGLTDFGKAMQAMGINDVNGLLTTGGVQQQTDQAQKTFDYNEFLRQIQQPYQKLQGMNQSVAAAKTDTTTNSQSQKDSYSNPLAGILGAGLGIAGMFGTGGLSGLGGLAGLLGGGSGVASTMKVGNQYFPMYT